ncbi:MAG TPA: DUF6599 family protein [Terriglobales bacterium]|nr:DUF6599 family protein [Terriglobales bacterium]
MNSSSAMASAYRRARFPGALRGLLCLLMTPLFACILAFAADRPSTSSGPRTPSESSASLLPKSFAGWRMQGSPKLSKDPAVADQVNAGVLNEYGFTDFAGGTYTRDDGRKLTIRAARFSDASGAYGAFTFYKSPEMLNEKIGDQASSLNNRVLFYRGNVLVDALFEKLSAMSAAELRELAASFVQPAQSAGKLPGLPAYLPKEGYIRNTARYVVGPIALDKIGAPVSSQLVDFASGAEVVLGNYTTSGGEATLMLINYPTPQLAAQHLRALDNAHPQNAAQQPGSPTLVDAGPFFDKRTGPIIAVVTGPLSQSEAKSLLASVNYDADVTWNQNTSFSKKDNLANLLVNIIILCFILIGFALVAGVAFGGVRILAKRIFPDRLFDRPEQVEFISLHLTDQAEKPSLRT